MKNTDIRVDAYIKRSAPFAIGILNHLRKQVHKACPGVTETIKWGFPHFEYEGMLCFMAGFKSHCTFGFWRGDLLKGLRDKANKTGEKGMGQFGRIRTIKDLPSDAILNKWIVEAAKLNEKGKSTVLKKIAVKKKTLSVPAYFTKAINTTKLSATNFKKLTPSQQNEYVEWITEAKTEATRLSRMKSMIAWIKEGKPRNWKYMDRYK
ncbi:MAG: hypothetical protein EYC69_01420 [Bacteroidetes bacterium]|nr:MAG: hypothetical protein EYC69_01420 [Bacteroidota bacterium]